MQRLPQEPNLDAPQPGPPGLVGCLTLGLGALFFLAGLVGLTLLSSGLFMPALLTGGAFFAYIFFHYVVWGWWLSGVIRRESQREEAALRRAAESAGHASESREGAATRL